MYGYARLEHVFLPTDFFVPSKHMRMVFFYQQVYAHTVKSYNQIFEYNEKSSYFIGVTRFFTVSQPDPIYWNIKHLLTSFSCVCMSVSHHYVIKQYMLGNIVHV